jgi:hypothetical protein
MTALSALPDNPLITEMPLRVNLLKAPFPMPEASNTVTPSDASCDAISELHPQPSGDSTKCKPAICLSSEMVNMPKYSLWLK